MKQRLRDISQKSLLLLFGGGGDPPRGQPAPIPPERYRWVAYGVDGTGGEAQLRASARIQVFGRYAQEFTGSLSARMTAVVAAFAKASDTVRGASLVAFTPVVIAEAVLSRGRFGEQASGRSARQWVSPGEDEELLAAVRASGMFGGGI